MRAPIIDCLQYTKVSSEILDQMRVGRVDAVHVTIAYHENFREMVMNLEHWNRIFEEHSDIVFKAQAASDVQVALDTGRTAVFFGFQNPSPIEDDIGLVEICHQLGIKFMQLSYNNQSLLATGCYEDEDPGLTRMGREVVSEMNRLGMVVDMSHSSERSTLDAIEWSRRPIAITHANPNWWHMALRNKSDAVLKALSGSEGMLGFSIYPHHLLGGSLCSLTDFCEMIAEAAERYGVKNLGLGTDLCQGQPDSVVEWMRVGRWTKKNDYGEGSSSNPGFPSMPKWFKDNRDFENIGRGLREVGFSKKETEDLLGGNWLRFFEKSFPAE